VVRETGFLPVARACAMIRQAALGLQHAHEGGVMHGDVRPGHLIASPVGDGGAVPTAGDVRTAPGVMVKVIDLAANPTAPRTLAYSAPELCLRIAALDARADLYGLGATLYYLLAGKAPFTEGKDAAETMQTVVTDTPPPLESLRADVPAPLSAIVRKLMAKKPAERFASAAELAAALEPFCHEIPEARHAEPAHVAEAWPAEPVANGDAAHAPGWPAPTSIESEHNDLPWNSPAPPTDSQARSDAPAGNAARHRPRSRKGWLWIIVGLFLHLTAIAILLYAFFPEFLVSIGIPIEVEDKTVQEQDSNPKKASPKLEKRKTGRADGR
jgi:serine/threonine protein kinase